MPVPFHRSVHLSAQHMGASQRQTPGCHGPSPLGSRRQTRSWWVLMGFLRGAKRTLQVCTGRSQESFMEEVAFELVCLREWPIAYLDPLGWCRKARDQTG